jgi:hypothetical protein
MSVPQWLAANWLGAALFLGLAIRAEIVLSEGLRFPTVFPVGTERHRTVTRHGPRATEFQYRETSPLL